jgi:hypothetical protein
MKNQIRRIPPSNYLIVVLFLVTLIFPSHVIATSGSCSYHGGVACSLGSDYDGSVICNDGWRDSSVSFSDANECKSTLPSCPIPSGAKSDCGSLRAQLARGQLLGTSFGDNELTQCETQNSTYDSAQSAYQQCLSSQSAIQSQQFNTYADQSRNQDQIFNQQMQAKYDAYCASSQGSGSVWVGEFGPSGSCNPTRNDFLKSCQAKMGTNAIYDKSSGYCTCFSGYVADSNNQCVIEPEPVTQQQNIPEVKPVFATPPVQKIIINKKPAIKPTITPPIVQQSTTTISEAIATTTPIIQPVEHKSWFGSLFEKIGRFFTNLFH